MSGAATSHTITHKKEAAPFGAASSKYQGASNRYLLT